MTKSKFYRVLSLVLAFVMTVSLFSNWTMPIFAENGIITEPIDPVITTAFKDDEVELYAAVADGALSTKVTGASGKTIQLYNKVTNESTGEVFYQFRLAGLSTSNLGSVVDEYSFVAADEVEYQEKNSKSGDPAELMYREMTDGSTGVQVNATVPRGATLKVSKYTVPQAGVENGLIWGIKDSVFYNVKIMYDGQEYQPENGAVVIFPTTAIPIAEGKTYTTYYYDNNDVLNSLNIQEPYDIQEGISVAVDYVGVVGVAVDFTEKNGNETYELLEETLTAKFANSAVKLYADNTLLEYKEFAVAENDIVSISAKSTIVYDNGNTVELYLIDIYGYSGDNAEMEEAITPSGDGLPYFYVLCSEVEEYISSEPEIPTVSQTLTDKKGTGITVSGNLPEGVTLEVSEIPSEDVSLIVDTNLYPLGTTTKAYDIKLVMPNGTEYDPNGYIKITITKDNLEFDGHTGLVVYHNYDKQLDVIGPVIYGGNNFNLSVEKDGKFIFTDLFKEGGFEEIEGKFNKDTVILYRDLFPESTTFTVENATSRSVTSSMYLVDQNNVKWRLLNEDFMDENDEYYVWAKDEDIKQCELLPEMKLVDEATGIKVEGNLPENVVLTVTPLERGDIEFDEELYPMAPDMFLYDITLSLDGQPYQPENEVFIIFPESMCQFENGLFYCVYHVHDDGTVEVMGPYGYVSGDIKISVNSFSAFGISDEGVIQEEIPVQFKNSTVTLYQGYSNSSVTVNVTDKDIVYVYYKFIYEEVDENGEVIVEKTQRYYVDYYVNPTDENFNQELYNVIKGQNGSILTNAVNASDIVIAVPMVDQAVVDPVTGITVSGSMPQGTSVLVKEESIPADWNTVSFPLGNNTKIFDISLSYKGIEYQPNGYVKINIPKEKLGMGANRGLAIYHIHNDIVDVIGPVVYAGGDFNLSVDNFSDFVFTDAYGVASNKGWRGFINKEQVEVFENVLPESPSFVFENAYDYEVKGDIHYQAEDESMWLMITDGISDENGEKYFFVKSEDVRITYLDGYWTVKPVVSFTNVAALQKKPLVSVEEAQMASTYNARLFTAGNSRAGTTDTGSVQNGLYMSKDISEPNADGVYTITLEAYVTGTVTVTRTSVPTDVVLVLDQSGSMDDKMGSYNYTSISNKKASNYYNVSSPVYIKVGNDYYPVTITRNTPENAYTEITGNNEAVRSTSGTKYVLDSYGKYRQVTITRQNNWGTYIYTYSYTDSMGDNHAPTSRSYDGTPPITVYKINNNVTYTYTYSYIDANGVQQSAQFVGNNATLPSGYYTATFNTNNGAQRLASLKSAVQNFVENVAVDAVGEDGVYGRNPETGVNDDVNHRIAVVGFAQGSKGYNSNSDSDYTDNDDIPPYENAEVFVGSNQYKYGTEATAQYGNAMQDMNTAAGLTNVRATVGYPTGNISGVLAAKGATYIDLGLEMANGILAKEAEDTTYVDDNGNVVRNRVVIVFTDGSPGWSGSWSGADYNESGGNADEVAERAIENARIIKNIYGATVYTIGIFAGADAGRFAINSDNTVTLGYRAYDGDNNEYAYDNSNRYMHYLSSNYTPETNATSASMTSPGTETFPRTNGVPNGDSFYLSAANSEELNSIFQKLSENINGSTNSTLEEETVVKDIISPAFKLPAGADEDNIIVKTYKATAYSEANGYTWVDEGELGDAIKDIKDDTIDVSGFNFKANYVATTARKESESSSTPNFHGRKLHIEIPIVVREDFLGGNQVPTNGEGSGIYENDTTTTPVREFVSPKVDVPLKTLYPVLVDQHIYLTNPANVDKMISDYTDGNENYKYEFKLGNTIYKFDGDNNGYVNVTYKVYDSQTSTTPLKSLPISAGQTLGSWTDLEPLISGLTEDETYYIECVVAPTTAGEYDATTSPKDDGTVYVYKPTVTVKDSIGWLGDNVPVLSDGNNYVSNKTVWKHETYGEATSSIMGTAPIITNEYTITGNGVEDGIIVTTSDIPVNVKSIANGTDITKHTTYVHQNCSGKTCTPTGDAKLLIHVNTVSLNVSKTVDGSDKSGDFTVTIAFNGNNFDKVLKILKDNADATLNVTDGEATLTFALAHNQTITLANLPVGTYTATETVDNNRYDTTVNGNTGTSDFVTLSSSKTSDKIAFVNKLKAGHLTIYKTVEMPEGVAINEGEEFKFTVTGTDYSETVTITVGKDGKGSVTINNLVQGNYIVTENLTVVQERLYTPDNVTQTVTVSAGSTTNAYVKNVAKTGILKVTKTVVDKAENIKPADKYTMEIALAGDIVVEKLIGTIGGTAKEIPVTDGIATIELANGTIAQFTNIPVGVTYKVTETDVDTNYYTVSYNNEEGTITADTKLVTVTNTRNYGKLTITKKIQDANGKVLSANAGETFVFNVIKPDGKTMQVVIEGTGSVTLTNLPLGSYTVTEDESWSYKYTSLYTSATVSVTENNDAYAEIINKPKDDKWLKADAYEENVFNK